jgi:hypothetical protein
MAKSRDLTLGLRVYVRVLDLHGSYLRARSAAVVGTPRTVSPSPKWANRRDIVNRCVISMSHD